MTPEKLADILTDAFRVGRVSTDFCGDVTGFEDASEEEIASVIRGAMQENEAETAKGLLDLDERNAA
jgi:hypothetical protein